MTYLYYKTSSTTHTSKPSKQEITEWTHMSTKGNWRITQLPNGYYQTEVSHPAIDGSIDYFCKKLEATKGPKIVKTFKN